MEHVEQVELICVLETVCVVLQGVVTVGFLSVPSLFYLAGEDAVDDPDDKEELESMEATVTSILLFLYAFLLFLLIAQIIVVGQLKAGFKEKNPGKLKPWLVYNLLFYFILVGATICGIIFLTRKWPIHVFNFCFLLYRGWTLLQVLLFYRELSARVPLNSPASKQRTNIETNDDVPRMIGVARILPSNSPTKITAPGILRYYPKSTDFESKGPTFSFQWEAEV